MLGLVLITRLNALHMYLVIVRPVSDHTGYAQGFQAQDILGNAHTEVLKLGGHALELNPQTVHADSTWQEVQGRMQSQVRS